MNGTGDQLLAGAGLALDQDRALAAGDQRQGLEEPLHVVALRDDVLELVALLELLPQLRDLA